MTEFIEDGIVLLNLGTQPPWMKPPAARDTCVLCFGCYYDECDATASLSAIELGRKDKTSYSCAQFDKHPTQGCSYCMPKDYYERHKPK